MVLAENRFGDAADVVTAAAEKLLAPVLAPVLIAHYDAGEPVTCGPATIGPAGISSSGRPGKPWALAWQDMDIIETTMHGQRVTVTHDAGRRKRIQLDGEPNSFLARYLIAHAAARAGVAETSDPPLLPGII